MADDRHSQTPESGRDADAELGRLNVLLAFSREVLNVLDDRLVVRYRSPSLQQPLGYPDGLVGRSTLEIIHPDDQPHVMRTFASVLEKPEATAQATFRVRHADGSWRVLDATATNLIQHPDVGGVLVCYRDVTEERRAQERLIEASRLASVGTLAAGVGHEINNPLTSVLGNLQLALELLRNDQSTDPPIESSIQECIPMLEDACASAERIAEIVRELRALATPSRHEVEKVDVAGAVERALTMIETQVERSARIVRALDEVPSALAAESRLVQVIINLVMNAAEAFPEAGPNNEVRIATAVADGHVWIAVSDNGCGIAPESISRIFDPYYTTKAEWKSAGLGLWVVRRMVESFGGRVEVESELGRGSTFRVWLRTAPT